MSFLKFLVELGDFLFWHGTRKKTTLGNLLESLHTHLRQHGKLQFSPGPWPPVNLLKKSINHRLYYGLIIKLSVIKCERDIKCECDHLIYEETRKKPIFDLRAV